MAALSAAMSFVSALGDFSANSLLSHLDLLFPVLAIAADLAVLFLLWFRKIGATLPLFSCYIVWAIVSDCSGVYYLTHSDPTGYYHFYLVEMVIDSLLMFAVLVELAWSILRPVRASLPRTTIFVLAALVGVAGLVIWPIAGLTVPPGQAPSGRLLFHLQETFAILRVVCFVVMASFSQLLSIGWRDRELQVATGLGFYSIISLIVNMMHSNQMVGASYHWLDLAVNTSYLGTLSYWVFSFSAKEQERKNFSPQMQQLLLLMSGGARVSRTTLDDLPSNRSRKRIK